MQQASVGHAEVVLGLAEVEFAHRRQQPGGARRRAQDLRELLRDARVLGAGAGNHVPDTLPDLVEAIDAGAAAALEQRLELRWRRAEHKRGHDVSVSPGRPVATPLGTVFGLMSSGRPLSLDPGSAQTSTTTGSTIGRRRSFS